MAASNRLQQVKGEVEEIFSALTAIQEVVKVSFDQQSELPSGKVTMKQYRKSPLGQRHMAGADKGYSPGTGMVIIGFWTEHETKFTGSGQVAKILSAALRETKRLENTANTKKTKPGNLKNLYQRFLRAWTKLNGPNMPEMLDIEREMKDLDTMMRPGSAFKKTEAEARMATYLMCNKLAGIVNFYATHSPCGDCSSTIEHLRNITLNLDKRNLNPVAHTGEAFKELRSVQVDKFQWQLGNLYYGRKFRNTDDPALKRAVKNGSLVGCEQVPV